MIRNMFVRLLKRRGRRAADVSNLLRLAAVHQQVLPAIADGSIPRPQSHIEFNRAGEMVITFVDGLVVNLGRMIVTDSATGAMIGVILGEGLFSRASNVNLDGMLHRLGRRCDSHDGEVQ